MSSMVEVLEQDPALLAQLAASSGNSLAAITARQVMKARRIEAERQIQRDREAIERHVYEEHRHARAMAPPVPPAPRGFTEGQVRALAKGFGAALAPELETIKNRFGVIEAKMLAENVVLKGRIAELEQRPPPLQYDGVWDEARSYTRGSFCTFQGSLWYCEDGNIGVRPGAGSSSWRLAVKRGRAADR
jgi:hypothetical protein